MQAGVSVPLLYGLTHPVHVCGETAFDCSCASALRIENFLVTQQISFYLFAKKLFFKFSHVVCPLVEIIELISGGSRFGGLGLRAFLGFFLLKALV